MKILIKSKISLKFLIFCFFINLKSEKYNIKELLGFKKSNFNINSLLDDVEKKSLE